LVAPTKFLWNRFPATDEKYLLNAFEMTSGLLDGLSLMFIDEIVLKVFLLLVIVLTMFHVVLVLLLVCRRSLL